MENNYLKEALSITFAEARRIGEEYADLLFSRSLSKEDEERISKILELATTNECIDFWISLETLRKGTEHELTDSESLKSYENQKAWLQEYLGTCQMTNEQAKDAMDDIESSLRDQVREMEGGEMRKIFSAVNVTTK